jgi:hypothetical protein
MNIVVKETPSEIIDRKELMRRLKISEPFAIECGRNGTIPEIRRGRWIRYNWPAVIKSLEAAPKKRK